MLDKMHNKNFGYNSETIVKKYYERLGWTLLEQNKTEKGSEIDLIMQKSGKSLAYKDILFIEVKAIEINNKEGLTPEDNFTKLKQRNFKRGIELYLTKNNLYKENIRIRIDLACLYYHKYKNEYTIKIYDNIILE